jgi:hypothetical protein
MDEMGNGAKRNCVTHEGMYVSNACKVLREGQRDKSVNGLMG